MVGSFVFLGVQFVAQTTSIYVLLELSLDSARLNH